MWYINKIILNGVTSFSMAVNNKQKQGNNIQKDQNYIRSIW